jgi:AcrR family transcriptional regulator
MAPVAKLVAVKAGAPEPSAPLDWRSDLDPVALPTTGDLSAGQRKVLQACLELFADQGFAASSVREIAAAAGMQSASLYNHFPSKDAMLAALCVIGHESHLDGLMTAVINAASDPRQQLAASVRAHVLAHCTHARLGLVVNQELRHLPPDAMATVVTLRSRSSALTSEILRRGEQQGVFHLIGRDVTLAALGSMGVAVARWYPYQTDFGADQLAEDYAQLALRMVGAVA